MLTIILVKPRNPLNIGAVARAMANFGLSDLRLVDVHSPNYTEAASAVGAQELLKKAKLFDTLPAALEDCVYALASTSLKNRNADIPIVPLPQINAALKSKKGRVAIVFGSEKTGLSNEHIAQCNAVLNIPSAAAQPSINLAQAVTLTCYELSKNKFKVTPAGAALPTRADIEILLKEAQALARAKNLLPALTTSALAKELRGIICASNLNKKQLFTIKKFLNLLK